MPETIPREFVNIPVRCAFCKKLLEAGLYGVDDRLNEDVHIAVRPCPDCLRKEREETKQHRMEMDKDEE